ncbi:MAG: enoyl-CoA hydratase [Actinomycetota bacterium]|nr:enoyl-CoA hydratase [Actinomycetota bacterium]
MNFADLTAVLAEQEGGLLTVTLNRPKRKNAISAAMWNELDALFTHAAVDPSVRAVVLTGAEGNFSAGADLSGEESNGLTGHGRQLILHEMRIVGGIISRIKHLPKPTIAAVDGVAVGVALGVALACDLVIASDRARFMELFVKRGLALDGGTSWTLPHLVGIRRAKQLAFFGDTLDAATALDWGLVNEVVPADELPALAAEWGRKLADGPTTAISLMKTQLDSGLTASFAEAMEGEARAQHIVYTTKDMEEGIKAYLERREPKFTGE